MNALTTVFIASVLSERRIKHSCCRWKKHQPEKRLMWRKNFSSLSMTSTKHMTSNDIWIDIPLRVMVWQWIASHSTLASCCLAPRHINCIMSVFGFRQFDVIYFLDVCCYMSYQCLALYSFGKTIKLYRICIRVSTKAMLQCDVSDVSVAYGWVPRPCCSVMLVMSA